MKLIDLIERNNRLSHTKIAYIIGVLVTSWVVIFQTIHDKITSDLILYYLGATVFGTLGSKGTSAFFNNSNTSNDNSQFSSTKPPKGSDAWQ